MTKLKLKVFLSEYVEPDTPVLILLKTGDKFLIDHKYVTKRTSRVDKILDVIIDKKYFEYEVDFVTNCTVAGIYEVRDRSTLIIFIKEP